MKQINGYVFDTNDQLGKGSFGCVYRGIQEGTQKICAIKVIQKKSLQDDEYMKNAIIQEMQVLQQVKSRNIVQVYDIMESTNNYYIVQELCDSDLEHYMRYNSSIPQKKAVQFLKQIVNGFISLVKEGIIHRDVKPANILMSKGELKIGDFGFAKRNTCQKMKIASRVGTPLYMSAQVLKGQAYTSKCDVWAVGFIFYELLHDDSPWQASSRRQLAQNIIIKPLVINERLSPETKDFLKKTLAVLQRNRMSWDEVFQHPIFGQYFDRYRENNKKIQDKLKVVMTSLRFKINSSNIDVKGLLERMQFKTQKQQLNFSQFKQFMYFLNKDLSNEDIRFFFDRIDEDCSGTISVYEIEKMMNFHKIRTSILKKAVTSYYEGRQDKELGIQLESKAKKCFIRLYRVLTYKKISLRKTFEAYDKSRLGSLTLEYFKNMIILIDSSFSQEDILALFQAIDLDNSNSIQFEQLNCYYCKVNGLPSEFNDFIEGSI